MSEIPYLIAAQQSIVRQNATMSMIKQAANMQQALVDIIDQAARSVPASSSGRQIDLRV